MKKGKLAVVIVLLLAISFLVVYIAKRVKGEDPINLTILNPTTETTTDTTTTTESEAERLAREEAKREEERIALEKKIAENTVYVGAGSTAYKVLTVEDIEEKNEETGESKVVKKVDVKEPLELEENASFYVCEIKEGYYQLKKDYYDEEIYGYVAEEDIHKSLADFIQYPLDDCDYNFYKKNDDFPNNPRVEVHGLYLTEGSFLSGVFDDCLEVIKQTDLNAMVIDIKDDSESLLFFSEAAKKYNPAANDYAITSKEEVKQLVQKARDQGVYMIARIVTFKSKIYSREHKDGIITYKGTNRPFTEGGSDLLWTSPADKNLWEYNVGLAEEAAELGFNEIQFDYVRFPAVPLNSEFHYEGLGEHSKSYAIQSFLKFAYERLTEKEVYVSADVFGWAATALDDVGIGQHWEAMANVCDYVCPMLYPSHYGEWNFGVQYPDTKPYEVLYAAGSDCVYRNKNIVSPAKIRPWIQDFTASYIAAQGLQYIPYGKNEINAQIKALSELGIDEYLLWNPGNYYPVEKFK